MTTPQETKQKLIRQRDSARSDADRARFALDEAERKVAELEASLLSARENLAVAGVELQRAAREHVQIRAERDRARAEALDFGRGCLNLRHKLEIANLANAALLADRELLHKLQGEERDSGKLRDRLRKRSEELEEARRLLHAALTDRENLLGQNVRLQRELDNRAQLDHEREFARQKLLERMPELKDKLCSLCDTAYSPLVENLEEYGLANWGKVCEACLRSRMEKAKADGRLTDEMAAKLPPIRTAA